MLQEGSWLEYTYTHIYIIIYITTVVSDNQPIFDQLRKQGVTSGQQVGRIHVHTYLCNYLILILVCEGLHTHSVIVEMYNVVMSNVSVNTLYIVDYVDNRVSNPIIFFHVCVRGPGVAYSFA